jgi:hypothetical protein
MDVKRLVKINEHTICSALGITCDSNKGRISNKGFYTEDCFILSTTFNDSVLSTKWKTLRPVRCLTHPFTTISLHNPATLKKDLKEGTSVVGIDLALLGYQFQQWFLENQLKPKGEQETFRQFITMFVLPGMIKEQVDIALRNQLEYIIADLPIPKGKSDPRGKHYDYDEVLYSYNIEIAKIIKYVLNTIKIGKFPYMKALANIPFIFKDTYLNSIPDEQNGLNGNCYWVTLVLYTDWVYRFIYIIDSETTANTNIGRILERVQRTVNSYRADLMISSKSVPAWYRWLNQFEEIKKKYN